MILNHFMGYIYEQTHSTVRHVGFVVGLSVTLVLNGISASKQGSMKYQPRCTEVQNLKEWVRLTKHWFFNYFIIFELLGTP